MIINRGLITLPPPVTPTPDSSASGPPPVPFSPPTQTLGWSWSAPWLSRAWDLTDPLSPVLKLEGAKGIGPSAPTHWFTSAPTLDGSVWQGARTPMGEVFVPILIQADDEKTLLDENAAFFRSLDPTREGYLRITKPDGSWRQIGCRYVSGGELTADYDPLLAKRATYGITWATPDPFWSGELVSYSYRYETGSSFFPGPPFVLGSGLSLSNARATNPGDLPTHAVWRIHGPYTAFSVGVGASVVSVNLTRAAGQWVEIDMRPTKLTIRDEAGVDRRSAVTARDFTPIPAGRDVPVTVSVTGAAAGTQADLSFTPKYRAAW